mmetsp:Transcript_18228/g.37346  ORF Transcript_18228/g.37346 Transcript_18228/m.37346 type:complete len:117 (-) Transcript_18228:40-390(-)
MLFSKKCNPECFSRKANRTWCKFSEEWRSLVVVFQLRLVAYPIMRLYQTLEWNSPFPRCRHWHIIHRSTRGALSIGVSSVMLSVCAANSNMVSISFIIRYTARRFYQVAFHRSSRT